MYKVLTSGYDFLLVTMCLTEIFFLCLYRYTLHGIMCLLICFLLVTMRNPKLEESVCWDSATRE